MTRYLWPIGTLPGGACALDLHVIDADRVKRQVFAEVVNGVVELPPLEAPPLAVWATFDREGAQSTMLCRVLDLVEPDDSNLSSPVPTLWQGG